MKDTGEYTRKLLTIVTETAIEDLIIHDLDELSVTGYTITNARGKGSRGVRNAGWETTGNIRIEIVCDQTMAKKVSTNIKAKYYENYAMIIFMHDVEILRPEKF